MAQPSQRISKLSQTSQRFIDLPEVAGIQEDEKEYHDDSDCSLDKGV